MINYEVLIPAFNAQSTIGQLIKQIRELKCRQPELIRLVDDGSSDSTALIAKNLGIDIISIESNSGKGFALKTGFRAFLETGSAEYLLCMDADLQHPVVSIPDFLKTVSENSKNIVIGNRKKNLSAMPFLRVLSNNITSFILTRITDQKISDSQCGFRLIHRDVLKKIELRENGFQLESEFIIEAAKKGIAIHFIEIPTIYNHRPSHINHVADTWRFIRLVMREVFRRK